ncbi:cation transporter [Marinospirillum sp.]|uniref:cation transporter n=1 Tax=Marinospirillum sp. TaxID=2183934 RepID=UPI002870440A|nr:cation transporter [Marinospirillum sp.]MDR9468725.1 cation transporter [Marinospirillum sp.]
MPTVELKLMGLTCNGCVNKVTEALMSQESVDQVDVSQEAATITGSISPDEAIEVIENLGFEAEE